MSGFISKFFKASNKPKKEKQHQLNIIGQLQNAAEVQTELNLDIMRSRKDTIEEPHNMRPTNVTYSHTLGTSTEENFENPYSQHNSQIVEPSGKEKQHIQEMAYDGYIDFEAQLSMHEQSQYSILNQSRSVFQQDGKAAPGKRMTIQEKMNQKRRLKKKTTGNSSQLDESQGEECTIF